MHSGAKKPPDDSRRSEVRRSTKLTEQFECSSASGLDDVLDRVEEFLEPAGLEPFHGKPRTLVVDPPQTNPRFEEFRIEKQLAGVFDRVGAGQTIGEVRTGCIHGRITDGDGGLKVLQLTSPDSQPKFYGFSPEPKPELIASYPTGSPALSISRGLERDRGVDETGGQVAVFGRLGSRPLNLEEMRRLFTDKDGKPWYVEN